MRPKPQRRISASDLIGSSAEIRQRFEETVHSFKYAIIATELDVAITFCKVALSAIHRERFDENLVNATNAFEAAKVLLEETNLTIPEDAAVRERLDQLDKLMEVLKYRPEIGHFEHNPPAKFRVARRTLSPRSRSWW